MGSCMIEFWAPLSLRYASSSKNIPLYPLFFLADIWWISLWWQWRFSNSDFDHHSNHEHLIYGFSCGLECKFYPTVSHSLAHYSLWVWNLLCYLGNMKSHKCSWMRWLWSSHYSHEHFSNGLLCRLKKLSRLHESPQIKCSWVWWLWELIIWWSSLSHQAGSS